jgi:hypothetical protein
MPHMNPKLFVGPVSKNTVDASIEFATEHRCNLGLIPSRRQIDYNGGYVGWDTKGFAKYVRGRTPLLLLERDHGGPAQGQHMDSGITSFTRDAKIMDIIHIDPWKRYDSLQAGINSTVLWIRELSTNRPSLRFEIGTEQAIFPYSPSEIDMLIRKVVKKVGPRRISYVVIQSGTSLRGNKNTGKYNEKQLKEMIKIVHGHGYLTKEHNGDYLSAACIRQKFSLGLDAINIAPEFGMIESDCYLDAIKKNDIKLLDILYKICYDSGKWKKWVGPTFDAADKEALIRICGHYVLNTAEFLKGIRAKLPNIDETIKDNIKARMHSICL